METFTLLIEDVPDIDLTNTVIVTGTPSQDNGTPLGIADVTASDPSSVDVFTPSPTRSPTNRPTSSNPAISVENTVYDGQNSGSSCPGSENEVVPKGIAVTYCFRITNTGDAPLTNINIQNPDLPSANITGDIPSVLNPMESFTVYVEGVPQTDLTNTVTVTGTPSEDNGTPLGLADVSDSDPSSVDVITPDIQIDNTVYAGLDSGSSCVGSDLQTSLARAPVTYCFVVTNTGDTPLTNVVVENPVLQGQGGTIVGDIPNVLNPNDSFTVYLEGAIPEAVSNFPNTARVIGTPSTSDGTPIGDVPTVNDEDDSAVAPSGTSIAIDNTVYIGQNGGTSCKGSELVTSPVGTGVTYCFIVTNTGTSPLTNINITNPTLEGGGASIQGTSNIPTILNPNESFTVYLEDVVPGGDLSNVAIVTGTPTAPDGSTVPGTPTVTDNDDSAVAPLNPMIEIDNTVYQGHNGGTSCPGVDLETGSFESPVTYCLVVTNTGNTRLNNVRLVDDALGIDTSIPDLLPGENSTVVVELTIPGNLDNMATTTGTPVFMDGSAIPGATDVTDNDPSGVRVSGPPSIDVQNTVFPGSDGGASCPGNETVFGDENDVVTYCFVVTNNGGETLRDISLSNPTLKTTDGGIVGTLDELAPGESFTFHFVGSLRSNLENTVEATGTPVNGDPDVSDSDPSSVVVILQPAQELGKIPTRAPTPSPSAIPTLCPTSVATCFDGAQTFVIRVLNAKGNEKKTREVNCAWLEEKESRQAAYCLDDSDAKEICRKTCDNCMFMPGDARSPNEDDCGITILPPTVSLEATPQPTAPQPTAPPSPDIPTPTAAPSPVCVDSDDPVFIYKKIGIDQDCEWLARRSDREITFNCGEVSNLPEMCPFTCGVCDLLDGCRDFMSNFDGFKAKVEDCAYIAEKEERIEKYCGGRSDAAEKCPRTCGTCLVPTNVQQACSLLVDVSCSVDANGEDCATVAENYRETVGSSDDCLVPVTFTFDITNPPESRFITSLAIMMNGMFRDATADLLNVVTPVSYVMSLDLDFCTGGTIFTEAEANSMMDCDEVGEYIIEIPTGTPTSSPTLAPSAAPTVEPSIAPTNEPTNEPTEEPTNEPTNVPTYEPTNEPSNDPTNEPTHNPTNEPTNQPTNKPTNEPTDKPTSEPTPKTPTVMQQVTSSPSPEPSEEPSESPSRAPTETPSKLPSAFPSSPPSEIPSASPSQVSGVCDIELTVDCSVRVPVSADLVSPTEECTDRPTAMSFVFIGGGCDQNINDQDGKYQCTDFIGGPVTSGSARITITDKKVERVYFDDIVNVSEEFALNTGNERVDADMSVTISDGGNTLQKFQYHSSCSKDLFLNDIFGGLRLMSFTNDKQGAVRPVTTQAQQGGPATMTCDAITPLRTLECEDRPSQMSLRYNGGSCAQTTNFQEGKVDCTDRNGGPPTSGVAILKITGGKKESGTTYFEGEVEVGERFDLNVPRGEEVDSDMAVSVVAGSTSQSLVFHSSCSKDLFLLDQFGAIQLVGFTNEDQGTLTAETTATFTYTVKNIGDVDADLKVTATRNGSNALETEGTFGADGQFVFTEVANIQMTGTSSLTTTAEVVGTTASGNMCNATDVFEVSAPTNFQQAQQGSKCNKRPTGMTFKFIGGDCDQNRNDQEGKYDCEDMAAGPITSGSATITISGKGKNYFNGEVAIGDTFSINTRGETVEADTDVTIVVDNQLVQEVQFHTSCSKDLFLNDIFGGLQLVGFTNEKQGTVSS